MSGCKCWDDINQQLAEHNTALETRMAFDKVARKIAYAGYLVISTTKVDSAKRGKPATVVASFCPFCGKNLTSQQQSQQARVKQKKSRTHGKKEEPSRSRQSCRTSCSAKKARTGKAH